MGMATEVWAPDTVAIIVNDIHRRCLDRLGSSLRDAIRLGGYLIKRKELLDHGEWITWVETNCIFRVRTAQGYMRVAREARSLGINAHDDTHLPGTVSSAILPTYSAALKLMANPSHESDEPEPPSVCPHCGNNAFDEDGDCTECRHPCGKPPEQEEAPEPSAADGDDEEDDEEEEEFTNPCYQCADGECSDCPENNRDDDPDLDGLADEIGAQAGPEQPKQRDELWEANKHMLEKTELCIAVAKWDEWDRRARQIIKDRTE